MEDSCRMTRTEFLVRIEGLLSCFSDLEHWRRKFIR